MKTVPESPIIVNELFNLTKLGLSSDLFKFGNLTLESEKYICVKDGSDCIIIDSSHGYIAERKPMTADAILMHRTFNIIAVRAE